MGEQKTEKVISLNKEKDRQMGCADGTHDLVDSLLRGTHEKKGTWEKQSEKDKKRPK